MSKHSHAFKLKIVREYLETAKGYKQLSVAYNVDAKNLRHWIRLYRLHGPSSLARRYTHYDTQFKHSVLTGMRQQSLSISEAAVKFNISSPSIVSVWQKLYDEAGIAGLQSQNRGRKPMSKAKSTESKMPERPVGEMTHAELIRELEYRRAEVAYLKKIQALVQASDSAAKRKPSQS